MSTYLADEQLTQVDKALTNVITAFRQQGIEAPNPFGSEEAKGKPWIEYLTKATPDERSALIPEAGIIRHPIRMREALRLFAVNEHHASCITIIVSAAVGLGLKEESVQTRLDGFCELSFQETINDVIEDFVQTGNGYLEVVRERPGGAIIGMFHIPCYLPTIVVEDSKTKKRHFLIEGGATEANELDIRMPCYGDGEDFDRRHRQGIRANTEGGFHGRFVPTSEIIHFRRSSSLNKHYGIPTWLAAVVSMEVISMMQTYGFDFFRNRGVPEMMIIIKGANVDEKVIKEIEKGLQAHVGPTNARKTMCVSFNATPENIDVQVEKLAAESAEGFIYDAKFAESLDMRIVSAHGVPPLLAGIMIPGKLGATNELPNALLGFQVLRIGPLQHYFTTLLAKTIGKDLGIKQSDLKFKTILEDTDLQALATSAQMREPLAGSGRDLREGLRE